MPGMSFFTIRPTECEGLRKQPKSPKWWQVSPWTLDSLVMFLFHIGKLHELTRDPETNGKFAPKKWMVGNLIVSFWGNRHIFSGELLVLGSRHEIDLAYATQET